MAFRNSVRQPRCATSSTCVAPFDLQRTGNARSRYPSRLCSRALPWRQYQAPGCRDWSCPGRARGALPREAAMRQVLAHLLAHSLYYSSIFPQTLWAKPLTRWWSGLLHAIPTIEIYRIATELRVSHFDAALTSSVGRLQINITSSLRAANWFG